MIGLVLALLAGFFLAASFVLLRRGVHLSGEISSTIPIFAFVGLVFFGVPVAIAGEIGNIASMSWLAVGSLAGAGLVHFIFGRILGFTSVRLIGANRAVPIYTTNVIIAITLGILLLGESFTVSLLVAAALVFSGIILISFSGNAGKKTAGDESLVVGILTALGAALCWGISPILVKVGLGEVDSPLLAAFISYAASTIIMCVWLAAPKNFEKLRRVDRRSLAPVIMAAAAMAAAHLFRYFALSYSDLVIVQPLTTTQGLFVFPLSFLLNRELEPFNLRVIFGAVSVVSGVFLIFWMG